MLGPDVPGRVGTVAVGGDEGVSAIINEASYCPDFKDLIFPSACSTAPRFTVAVSWTGLARRGRPDCRT